MGLENEDFSDEDQCQCTYTNSLPILIFQKMINKYNKTLNKKVYTLNS